MRKNEEAKSQRDHLENIGDKTIQREMRIGIIRIAGGRTNENENGLYSSEY